MVAQLPLDVRAPEPPRAPEKPPEVCPGAADAWGCSWQRDSVQANSSYTTCSSVFVFAVCTTDRSVTVFLVH